MLETMIVLAAGYLMGWRMWFALALGGVAWLAGAPVGVALVLVLVVRGAIYWAQGV